MTLAPVFRANLKHAYSKRTVPMKTIVHRSGYSEYYIRRIMRGEMSNPSLQFIETMGKTLGVSVAWLLGFEGTTDEVSKFDVLAQ